ncbi:MAG: hypothetical protein D6746_05015 [Bacteroidetes bacterium]|nr:MAG: hypothetical protein D6746_05015 [Bacteroidota bacterium]
MILVEIPSQLLDQNLSLGVASCCLKNLDDLIQLFDRYDLIGYSVVKVTYTIGDLSFSSLLQIVQQSFDLGQTFTPRNAT